MPPTSNIIVAALIAAGIAGCSPSDEQDNHDQVSQIEADQPQGEKPTPPRPDELAQSQRPEDQIALEALLKNVNDTQLAQLNAANQIIADKAFTDAYEAYCTKMQNDGVLKDWTARVKSIFDGKPPSIALETPGGLEAFQEIDSSSPLYQTLLTLKENDYVKFSMNVSHALKDAPGQTYQECATVDDRPHINAFLSGDVTAIAPLK